jgi:translation initiation factor 3 subunit L
MARGVEAVYDELFSYACPKFVAPRAPDFESPTDTSQSAYLQQLRLFLVEIRQQQYLATIKQYLKLYTVSVPSGCSSIPSNQRQDYR